MSEILDQWYFTVDKATKRDIQQNVLSHVIFAPG